MEKNRIRPTRLEKILSWSGWGQENWRNTGRQAQHLDMSVPDGDKEERWRIVGAGNATIISKKPATISKWQELQAEHSQEFLKFREVLLSKKKQLVFEEVKGNRPQLQKNYPTPKTICCLILVNLMLKTLKPSNTQFAPVKKKKAQSPRSPRKEELSSAMILILILIS